MISQPAAQPKGTSTASDSVPVQPRESGGLWAGLKVAIRDGVIPFLQSLHPGYIPPGMQPSTQPDEGPAFTIGSAHGQDSGFFQGVELGARLVSPFTVLPAEISALLEGFITISAAARLRELFGGLGTTTASASGQSRADSPVDGSPTNDKGRKKKAPQQIRQRTSPPVTASVLTGQLPNTSLALGALASLAAVCTSSASSPDTAPWVEVANAETLGKICHDAESCSKEYRLTQDIDGSQLNRSIGIEPHPFTGQLNGQGHTIGNLSHCLVENLKGRIDNLSLSDANIESTASAGVAACEMSGDAMISNILVERAYLVTEGIRANAAIGVGRAHNGGTVTNTTAVNCTVVTSKEGASAGIAAGQIFKGHVFDMTAVNCNVTTSGKGADAGIGAGFKVSGTVTGTTAVNCTVATFGKYASAGIGVGDQNRGTVTNTTAVSCTVSTSKDHAAAGIGAGMNYYGDVKDTAAVKCRVETSGEKFAPAGIGSGYISKSVFSKAIVANTVVVNCTVESKGKGTGTSANIMGGENTVICNVRINDEQLSDSPRVCRYWLDKDFCADIDHRLVTPDCLAVDTSNGANALLTPPITETAATVQSTTMTFSGLPGTTMTFSGLPGTTMTFSGLPGTTMTLPTNAAPLAASLSTVAITGIALGAAAFVLAGGVCVYRHYHRRSSASAAGDTQEELVTINTVGQEAGDQPMPEAVRKEAREKPVAEHRPEMPPPEPTRLKKPPIRARYTLLEEPGARVSPQHESIYEDIDIY